MVGWRRSWVYLGGAAIALGLVAAVLAVTLGGGRGSAELTLGLPRAHHYHSLLVNPTNPEQLLLGTHEGLYVSVDGGRHWRFDKLAGSDAMSLARPAGDTVWLAGHEVFKKSLDGGSAWSDVRPDGLPSLDIHGFAVDPRDSEKLYAAIAGEGLYRSADGGRSFSLVSAKVGGNVNGLAVMPDGRILAADFEQGLLVGSDGGATWSPPRKPVQLLGLAVNPSNPSRVLGTGAGIALSTDGGRTWLAVLDLTDGAGPVAWSSSDPKVAYAVGFNRTLYRSEDAGRSWLAVRAAD